MKKNVFNILLLVATVFSLGITVTSCKDDNEENKNEEQKEKEAQEKASKFWSVVGQLVSVDDVTEDYQGKTFEPTYGLPDPTNSVTRIVNTNDMKTAAQRFANLVNAKGIDENTPSYTWRDSEIGTMTYTRGGDAANWATVDVDIKAVPGLQRIIYREGGEGTNGKFPGKAYYRFGDVVSRQVNITYDQKKNNDDRGNITEYWICVRPAFGPEGKEDSHWVCVNTVSDTNYKYYKASTGTDYWLPTNLKTDKENMQNFAELLWAICYPDEWYKNVNEHHRDGKLWGFDGVPFFTDFKKANLDLHNQYFWQNVQDAWDRKQIAEQALNMPSLGALIDVIRSNGVRLLYNGYSWIFLTSWNCELSEAVYTNGKAEEELNMHHAVYNEDIERNMKDIMFDVRTMGKDKDNYNGFFNSDGKYRWVIRHATGKELASDKKYNVKQPINGMKEEYRYYHDMLPTSDLDGKPESSKDNRNITYRERGYYSPGDVVTDLQGNKWFCIQPSGYKGDYDFLEDYAYFVSFDQGAVGTNFENIPTSKNLAIQVLFDMSLVYRNKQLVKGGAWDLIESNIKNYAGLSIMELFAARDSTVKHRGDREPVQEINEFLSTFYRENGQLCILRAVGDFTHDQASGLREWSWYYWTNYSKDPERKMLLSDLADQSIINAYNEDPWVHNTWYDPNTKQKVNTNIGPRTQPEPITPLTRFIYQQGHTAMAGTAPTNMYREPLYAFAVKRVKDEGAAAQTFEDNTRFMPVRLMNEVMPDMAALDQLTPELMTMANTYQGYSNQSIYLNNGLFEFGMKNKP